MPPLLPRTLVYATLSGLLLAASFPTLNVAPLAWAALLPLLLASREKTAQKAFGLGTWTGLVAYTGLLYWIVPTFRAAEVSMPLGVGCTLLLALYLGLYIGLWAAAAAWIGHRLGPTLFSLFQAALWVLLEALRGMLFSGFPWLLLAYSQWHYEPLIQMCSLTGAYGVSFLIVFFNAALVTSFWSHGQSVTRRTYALTTALVVIALVMVYGFHTLSQPRPAKTIPLTVAVLQGNVDQYKKWDRAYVEEILSTYTDLSVQAASRRPDLIVWPETAVPGYLLSEPNLLLWIQNLARQTQTFHLVGAPEERSGKAYNAAFMFKPDGEIVAEYDKMHLVPFGETVPFQKLLGRWIKVLNELGGFAAGKKQALLPGPLCSIGTTICYESIFPHQVRDSVRRGADLLINLTNDAWFLNTSAPHHHLLPYIFRAVENRRYAIRAANTGISAIIDPYGHVVALSPLFQQNILVGSVAPLRTLTPYTRWGDVFLLLCGGIVLVGLAVAAWKGSHVL